MANTKKNQPKTEEVKPEVKVEDKIDIVQNMMANTKKREADKQRFIYSAMSGIQIIRN